MDSKLPKFENFNSSNINESAKDVKNKVRQFLIKKYPDDIGAYTYLDKDYLDGYPGTVVPGRYGMYVETDGSIVGYGQYIVDGVSLFIAGELVNFSTRVYHHGMPDVTVANNISEMPYYKNHMDYGDLGEVVM